MDRDRLESFTSKIIVYLAYDSSDSSVIKRSAMFQNAGLQVQGIMFRRQRVNPEFAPEWDNIGLGTIEDQAFFRRMYYLGRAMFRIWQHRRKLANVSLVYARNLDLAILGVFLQFISRRRPPLVYEVLDIHHSLIGDGTASKVLRFVEREILERSVCLVVSSLCFIDAYFVDIQSYCGPYHLIENKLSPQWLDKTKGKSKLARVRLQRQRPPWVLGWFGTLRCPVSLDLLTRLASALPDRFMLYLRGVPTDLGWERFNAAIKGYTNVVYEGRYQNPEDLAEIFSRVDFNWCVDMIDPEGNSKWLLPNRIYEGGYFNCPAIAIRGTATGQKVDELGLGHTFNPPFFENLVEFFESMTVERHQFMVDRISVLPRTEFCDDAQFRALLDRLSLPYETSARIALDGSNRF